MTVHSGQHPDDCRSRPGVMRVVLKRLHSETIFGCG